MRSACNEFGRLELEPKLLRIILGCLVSTWFILGSSQGRPGKNRSTRRKEERKYTKQKWKRGSDGERKITPEEERKKGRDDAGRGGRDDERKQG